MSADLGDGLLARVAELEAEVERLRRRDETATTPWPAGVEPTPEQLADWWYLAPRSVLLTAARRALTAAAAENRCFVTDHEGRLRHAEGHVCRGDL